MGGGGGVNTGGDFRYESAYRGNPGPARAKSKLGPAPPPSAATTPGLTPTPMG